MSSTVSPAEASPVWHWFLLRLAGRVPDDLITECRSLIAEGDHEAAATAVAFATAGGTVPITPDERDLLAAEFAAAGEPDDVIHEITTVSRPLPPAYVTLPAAPGPVARLGVQIPACLDLLEPHPAELGPDEIDTAAITAATTEPDIVGLFRTWRYPPRGTDQLAPKRIYLVLGDPKAADRPGDVAAWPALADRLATALHAAGEAAPQVEVFSTTDTLPPYQQRIRAGAALLRASGDHPSVRRAPAYDGTTPTTTIHDRAVRDRIAGWLNAGTLLMHTTAHADDLIDPDRLDAVPLKLRTDGHWIWSDATTYYLRHYGIAPDPELLHHIEATNTITVSPVALHKALAKLYAPAS